jgi:hypothetical protein
MGYPWYSERKGNAGKNGQFKISLEKNCETKEIRYVATIIDPSKRTGKKSISSMDLTELHTKVEKYLNTMETKQDGLLSDITDVFNIYGLTIESEIPEQVEEVTGTPVNEEFEPVQETIEIVNENNSITETKHRNFKVSKESETILIRGYMGKVEEREGKRILIDDFDFYLVQSSKYYAIHEKSTGKTVINVKRTKKDALDTLQETLNLYSDKLKELITATIEKDGYITDYKIGSWIRSA